MKWYGLLGVMLAGVAMAKTNLTHMSLLTMVPDCGQSCLAEVFPLLKCAPTDTECICNDRNFYDASVLCIIKRCPANESISHLEATVCERPYRTKRTTGLYALILEVPAWFFPWLRMWSAWQSLGRFETDDWLMVIVGLMYTPFLVIGFMSGQTALGVDMWFLDYDTISQALLKFYVDESLYLAILTLAKVSVIFFLLRIFPSRSFRIGAWVCLGLTVVPNIAFLFLQIFQCYPVRIVWEGFHLPYYDDYCLNVHAVTFAAAGFAIFQDIIILALPLPYLLRLRMDRRQKWGIMLMFCAGLAVTVLSSVRLVFIARFGKSMNPTWDYTGVVIWSGLELAMAIVVACMPAVGLLVRRTISGMSTRGGSTGAKASDTGRSSTLPRGRGIGGSSGGFRAKSWGASPSESQTQLGLELGDRVQGDVTATAMAGDGADVDAEDRIKVLTVTTVDSSPTVYEGGMRRH